MRAAWEPTGDSRVQIAAVNVPHLPSQPAKIGFRVRVWFNDPVVGLEEDRCDVCGKFAGARIRGNGVLAHECASKVPWRSRRPGDAHGWHEPHRAQEWTFLADGTRVRRLVPSLYGTPQLAYAAGLRILNIETPTSQHWSGAA